MSDPQDQTSARLISAIRQADRLRAEVEWFARENTTLRAEVSRLRIDRELLRSRIDELEKVLLDETGYVW